MKIAILGAGAWGTALAISRSIGGGSRLGRGSALRANAVSIAARCSASSGRGLPADLAEGEYRVAGALELEKIFS